jgi:very-short-patch-repair endonuclease
MTQDNRRPAHADISPRTRSNAKRMRSAMTSAERKFWRAVRAHRVDGWPFRRQVPIAGYIVDFVCHEKCLIVEIDGATHSTDAEIERDRIRTSKLEGEGYRVIRFWNGDIAQNIAGVVDRLMLEMGGGVPLSSSASDRFAVEASLSPPQGGRRRSATGGPEHQRRPSPLAGEGQGEG